MKFIFLLCLTSLASCQALTDRKDKEAVREQCRIPTYAKLVDFQGSPWMRGFGQREGLRVEAKFLIAEADRQVFETSSKNSGWEPLPISQEVRNKIRPGDSKLNLDASMGLYRCHYAGDNVLYAKETQPCHFTTSGVVYSGKSSRELNDMILSLYDSKSGEITAEIFSRY